MYTIRHSPAYRKAYKKLQKSGRRFEIQKLETVIDLLAAGKTLPEKYENHFLSGYLAQYQECHIKHDLLLMYYKDDENLILVLVKVGSHSGLFGK